MSLHKRLERLEGRAPRSKPEGMPDHLRRYFKELANIRRAEAGLDPLPYTPEDLEDDRRCLEEVIPVYRAAPGWQTDKARTFLDRWEQHIRENLQRGANHER